MRRVVILGRGASGKSTLAKQLGEVTSLPVIELDKLFWRTDQAGIPREHWLAEQRQLVQQPSWILDGDLGPYDAPEIRVAGADNIVLLDFPLLLCVWRAMRRSRQRLDFWRWVFTYRRKSLPRLLEVIHRLAPHAELHVLRSQSDARRFLTAQEASTKGSTDS